MRQSSESIVRISDAVYVVAHDTASPSHPEIPGLLEDSDEIQARTWEHAAEFGQTITCTPPEEELRVIAAAGLLLASLSY